MIPRLTSSSPRGNTSGVFQLESRGMRELLSRLRPSQFEDIIAINALYRPGPLGSGMIDDFIKQEAQPVASSVYETPLLKEALEETYGVIVYQEQIMKIATLLANFSKAEADALRKAISKKVPEQIEPTRNSSSRGARRTTSSPRRRRRYTTSSSSSASTASTSPTAPPTPSSRFRPPISRRTTSCPSWRPSSRTR